ncbi:hypothetical protein ABEB36_003286 [Hypothenemus hampei]|uniref:E3 ubiquitin-protein ligase RFWD3-like WD40 domain-containing protein n=1 Tax=Hypothenemus hampei TaxID=57062 RepID=A0ABD1FAH2_HYPHA
MASVSGGITHVGFTAKDTHCYAGCSNGEILLFNHFSKNLSCTLRVPKSQSLSTVKAHSHKRNYLIAGSNESFICVWDVNFNKVKFHNQAHQAPVSSAIFSPINPALIVSSGLDRTVRVFDIESNTRISTIDVENNVLSLDFIQDSLFIAMGCQNGKIYIYDTRSLQEPFHIIEAHNSSIKHLSYQTVSDNSGGNVSSLSNLESEEVITRKSASSEEALPSKKRTSDFFGLLDVGAAATNDFVKKDQITSVGSEDSFLAALNMKQHLNDSPDSVKLQEETNNSSVTFQPSKPARRSLCTHTPNIARIVEEGRRLSELKSDIKSNSTPNYPRENFARDLSPIISASQTANAVSQGEFEVAMKNMQAEFKKNLGEVEWKLYYQSYNLAHQIRRMILDFHMATFKEFIKVENNFNVLRDEMNIEPMNNHESQLLEENIGLKRRIEELEKEIANFKCRGEPDHGDK